MKKILSRVIGVTLILGGILGVLLSIGGIVVLWRIEPKLEAQVMDGLSLVSRTIDSTQSLLTVVDEVLVQVRDNLKTVETASLDVAETIDNTAETATSLGNMVSAEFSDIVDQTTNGLRSAQTSAKVIDDFLGFLANLPLIGNPNFKNDMPLNQSLLRVEQSLSPLTESFDTFSQELKSTSDNLSSIQSSVTLLTASFDKIDANLVETQTVVADYTQTVNDLDQRVAKMQETAPRTIKLVFGAFTALLAWLLIAQLGLITQGLERFTKKESALPTEDNQISA